MAQTSFTKKSRVFQIVVSAIGISVWLVAAANLAMNYNGPDLLIVMGLVPLSVVVGMFSHTFQLPEGMRFTNDRFTFTLVDSIILLVALWYGPMAAIFVHGIEGYTSSWRIHRVKQYDIVRDLFSSSMMSLATVAAAYTLQQVLQIGFGVSQTGFSYPLVAVAVSLLIASLVHNIVNMWLVSTLIALRYDHPVLKTWKQNFLWVAPMFLPTGTAATLIYFALQHDLLITTIIGAPIFLAIYLGHRQYRNSVSQRISIMEKGHRETIEALAVAINAKDEVTHEHVLRVQIYAAGVARLLGCSDSEVAALKAGALLHDIGKIAVPDYILNKPGKLTAAEFEKMKIHTLAGAQILSRVEFPYPVVPVVRHHHERWDGKGYPDGLAAENIPLTARILSVVDCFDAVREDRQYRRALNREEAINLIMEGSGTQYDPRVVGTFITNLPAFEAEILAHKEVAAPTFGIEEMEQLSEAARSVAPAAGLAESDDTAATAPVTTKQLRAIYTLTQAITGAQGRDQILETFMSKLRDLVPFETCAVTMVVPETGENVITHAAGELAGTLLGRKVTLGEGVTGWAIANLRSFCNTDPKLDFPPSIAQKFAAYKTVGSFPIIKDGDVLGAVSLYSSSVFEFTKEQQRLIDEASAFVATALSATQADVVPPIRLMQEPVAVETRPAQNFNTTPLNLSRTQFESELTH
jgi:putative nucleotidyltransferase with HDIG domain